MIWNYVENFQNIIWDWNGTLLDDHHAAWKAECKLFEKVGKPHLDVEARKKLFTMPVKTYYERVGMDFLTHSYEEVSQIWFEHYEKELATVKLFSGAEALLERIVVSGKKQFILSAAPQSHLEQYTEQIGIKKHFHGIYGLQSKVADCKRQRGRDLLAEHKVDPKTTLMIGDMVHDAEVAETLGCEVLLIADGHQDYEVLCTAAKQVLRSRY